ncbi:hypothetical protein EYF80_042599 [Liparis tanakae]|uniref:Uncharacterized protein n=1 Tax=Liparis tanakae TaxID=230148 RepID=A0A4Z2G0X3_9TELE|nr:hypothetical protein EYF80_042599 [Liparis tanakae]
MRPWSRTVRNRSDSRKSCWSSSIRWRNFRRTVTRAHALPGVPWGDVTGSGGGEVAQALRRQPDGVPAAARRAAGAQAAVVAQVEDAEAQRVLQVRQDACGGQGSGVRRHVTDSVWEEMTRESVHCCSPASRLVGSAWAPPPGGLRTSSASSPRAPAAGCRLARCSSWRGTPSAWPRPRCSALQWSPRNSSGVGPASRSVTPPSSARWSAAHTWTRTPVRTGNLPSVTLTFSEYEPSSSCSDVQILPSARSTENRPAAPPASSE